MGKHGRHAADHRPLRLIPHPDAAADLRTGVRDLEVIHDDEAGATGPVERALHAVERDDDPEGEPEEEFGLRVTWQSEAVKIEAAEFLIATRIQQDARIRASQDLARLREREEH
jgi:hypothetical protein